MMALEQAREYLEQLGLTEAAAVLDNRLDLAAQQKLSYPEVLSDLLGIEAAARRERYLKTRTRLAHLPFHRTLEEFEAVLARLELPMFTVMYADRQGNILHLFGGRTPRRPEGDYNWGGIVPGDTSATLWTEVHPYDELPRVLNPGSGWLQNANDPPWTTTFPRELNPDDYPKYMAPRFMHFRAQRSARMLMEDESIDFDEAVAYKLSTRMELADRILDDLAAAVEAHGDETAREAMAVLEGWDRLAETDSRGAVLFARFVRELLEAGIGYSQPWSEDQPMTTPDGLEDPAAAAAALARAAASTSAASAWAICASTSPRAGSLVSNHCPERGSTHAPPTKSPNLRP